MQRRRPQVFANGVPQIHMWHRFVVGTRVTAGDEEADLVQGPRFPRRLDGTIGEVPNRQAGGVGHHDHLIASQAEHYQEGTVRDGARLPVVAPRLKLARGVIQGIASHRPTADSF